MSVPDYYKIEVNLMKALFDSYQVDAMSLIDALGLNFNMGCVVKYVVRHGRKPGEPALKDLKKARDCLNREIARLEGQSDDA